MIHRHLPWKCNMISVMLLAVELYIIWKYCLYIFEIDTMNATFKYLKFNKTSVGHITLQNHMLHNQSIT